MGLQMNIFCYFVSTLFVTVGLAQPAQAQSSINDLMNDLNSSGPVEAKRLSREIERLWSQSGSVSIDLLLRRGREATEAGDFDVAIEHLTAVTDHAPNFAEGWHARATAFYLKGLYGPALDDLHKALLLNPNNYNAIFGLGMMLTEFDDLDRAEQAFSQVIDLNPNHENASNALERLRMDGIGREL